MKPTNDKQYTYVIINKVLDQIVYVGRSKNPQNRWAQHKSNAKSIGNSNERFVVYNLHRHICEFGVENFAFQVVANYDCEAELQEQYKPICCMKYEKMPL